MPNNQEDTTVSSIDLSGQQISSDILKEISEEAASFYQIVPIKKEDNVLWIGMVNPDDFKSKEALRFIAQRRNFKIKIFQISVNDFKNVLKQYRAFKEEITKALQELETEVVQDDIDKEKEEGKEKPSVEEIMSEAPITKIVSVILRHALEGKASDVHIEPAEKNVKVRFRVDGMLYAGLFLPKDIQASVVSRLKILANLKIDETRIPQDGRFHTVIDNRKIDFRVSTFPTVYGEKVALRLLDPSAAVKNFDEMGLMGHSRKLLTAAIEKPYGMILATGPTGSGKTTTLYGILQTINKENKNIVSLEDPVEYYIDNVSQSQIKPEIDYSFSTGLRSILRQDPDVIMVGEIRDNDTASLATHASLTGHIVLSTLHTNSSIGVIPRLIDMSVPTFLMPSSLSLAIAQRLVRKICEHCKKKVDTPSGLKKIIDDALEGVSEEEKEERLKGIEKPFKIWEAKGCKFCGDKGTGGRMGIYEVFSMTPQLEKIIQEKNITEAVLLEEAKRQKMVTMKQDGVLKALQGLVTLEEVLNVLGQSD